MNTPTHPLPETVIWWIRRDLRLMDNPTLSAAMATGKPVIPVFILDPALLANSAPRRQAFLLAGLRRLDEDLRRRGSRLIVRSGSPTTELVRLSRETNAVRVFAGEDYTPYARTRDALVSRQLSLQLHLEVTIHHPTAAVKKDGTPYTVFTPFRKAWNSLPFAPQPIRPLPERLPGIVATESLPLPDVDSPAGFPAGETEALRRLEAFLSGPVHQYADQRNRLDLDGTSSLSPYLRFGMISARQVYRAVSSLSPAGPAPTRETSGTQVWINELIWREFYASVLYHFPNVLHEPFQPAFKNIDWLGSPSQLTAWQEGRTGYPIVDACMRQLAHTGWMHNRGRMIVASFLTKDLLVNWQAGEAWFMRELIDGDPAANNGGWQWTAGTGTDAAPYFRIFNPILQGKKFDPHGSYIRRWLPELAHLPDELVHEPWLAGQPISGYPERIVDHFSARDRAVAAYRRAKTA